MLCFVINGETPSKKNNRIINRKTGQSFPSKRYTEWHKIAKPEIEGQMLQQASTCGMTIPLNAPLKIKMTFLHGDLTCRDSDNGASSILDLLQDCGVLADDNWQIVKEINIRNGYFEGKSMCKVEIDLL